MSGTSHLSRRQWARKVLGFMAVSGGGIRRLAGVNDGLWPGAAAALLGLRAATPATAAERAPAAPLLLAKEADAAIDPAGYLVSEKYDGVRAWWDGQQLRSRTGRPYAAPGWFTAHLPAQPLDGELWLDHGRFEALSGTVRKMQPQDAEWRAVRYMVFELPGAPGTFEQRAARLRELVASAGWPGLQAVAQTRVADNAELQRRLQAVVAAGGEGLALHRADAPYETGRSGSLLKLKPENDAEAVVLAHLPGKGRLAGKLGGLQVQTPEGLRFVIGTGLTDAVRSAPPPVGSTITYRYRGTTDKGVPRFASFLRVAEPEPS